MKTKIVLLCAGAMLVAGCEGPERRHDSRVDRRYDRHDRVETGVEGRQYNRYDRRTDRADRIDRRYGY